MVGSVHNNDVMKTRDALAGRKLRCLLRLLDLQHSCACDANVCSEIFFLERAGEGRRSRGRARAAGVFPQPDDGHMHAALRVDRA
eukprot:366433-Chlamydomonas_euryale.AAC.6